MTDHDHHTDGLAGDEDRLRLALHARARAVTPSPRFWARLDSTLHDDHDDHGDHRGPTIAPPLVLTRGRPAAWLVAAGFVIGALVAGVTALGLGRTDGPTSVGVRAIDLGPRHPSPPSPATLVDFRNFTYDLSSLHDDPTLSSLPPITVVQGVSPGPTAAAPQSISVLDVANGDLDDDGRPESAVLVKVTTPQGGDLTDVLVYDTTPTSATLVTHLGTGSAPASGRRADAAITSIRTSDGDLDVDRDDHSPTHGRSTVVTTRYALRGTELAPLGRTETQALIDLTPAPAPVPSPTTTPTEVPPRSSPADNARSKASAVAAADAEAKAAAGRAAARRVAEPVEIKLLPGTHRARLRGTIDREVTATFAAKAGQVVRLTVDVPTQRGAALAIEVDGPDGQAVAATTTDSPTAVALAITRSGTVRLVIRPTAGATAPVLSAELSSS